MTAPEQLDHYRRCLACHDWTFEYSDDHSVWRRGCAELAEIQRLQQQLDPKFKIWNEYAPNSYKRGTSAAP